MGLRERKKQKTRLALIDAALDLFIEQGYEATTIDQIAASVDVSPRTFFRYFGSKEDVALALPADTLDLFLSELSARPESESPFTAMAQAMRSALAMSRDADRADHERLMKTCCLLGQNPQFMAAQMRLTLATERRLIAEISRRRGCEDLRSHVITALFTAVTRVALEYGNVDATADVETLLGRLDETLLIMEESLRPGWDR